MVVDRPAHTGDVHRRGGNTVYDMTDICMAAYSVFFMQSPSFLALQTALQCGRGTSNCQTLFGMERIPSDNHIRAILSPRPLEPSGVARSGGQDRPVSGPPKAWS